MGVDVSRLSPWAQKQVLDKYRADLARRGAQPAQNERTGARKYHNTPADRQVTDGKKIRFDSKREAARYDELMLLLQAGEIRDLKLQPQFTLQEAYTTPEGKRVRAIRYDADFSYERMRPYWKGYEDKCPDEGWFLVVEDVKSKATKTRVYAIKKKLLRERFGIEITEVE